MFDMPPREIKSKLQLKEITQTEIAEALGIKTPSVNRVIKGTASSERVRRAIAEALNLKASSIWPSIYLGPGPRRPGRPKTTRKLN